ncbi:MAG: hypothetical protein ACR2MN_04410 [Acidimicrobiales bacterium]
MRKLDINDIRDIEEHMLVDTVNMIPKLVKFVAITFAVVAPLVIIFVLLAYYLQ